METQSFSFQPQSHYTSSYADFSQSLRINMTETSSPLFSGCYKTPIYIPKWDRILIGHYGSNKISLWNSNTLEIIDYRYTREQLHFCLAFSEKLNIIYSSGLGGQVTAMNVDKDHLGYFGTDMVSKKIMSRMEKITCIDNHDLIVCAGEGSNIYLLDSKTLLLKDTFSFGSGKVLSDIVYIAKNDILAVIGGDMESYLYLFCLKNMKCIYKSKLGCRELTNNALEFSSSRNMLITQSGLGTLKLWNVNCEKNIKMAKKIYLADKIISMLLVEELDCFIVGTASNKMHFFRIATGQLLKTVDTCFEVEGLMIMPKDKKIIASNKDLSQLAIVNYEL